jgi:hypothetical protein
MWGRKMEAKLPGLIFLPGIFLLSMTNVMKANCRLLAAPTAERGQVMKAWPKALGLGFLVWLLPFVVAFLVFPFRESWRALFESVMAVTLSVVVVWLGLVYLRKLSSVTIKDGVLVGLLWWAMSVAIDLPLMLSGPIKMSFVDYMADIGFTYAMIPIITTGLAIASVRPAGG